jgi:hypothetical protein
MKKAFFFITMIICTCLQAQVFNTAQTLRQGAFALGLEPAIYDLEGDNETALFLHGGYGISRGLDLGIKLGLGMEETYIGADLEWMLRALSPYISISAGAHMFNDVGIDGTLNFTFPLNKQLWLYSGLDLDIVFAENDTFIPFWLPVGLEVAIRRNMTILLEVEIALNEEAYNIFGGGIQFYF